MNSSSHYEHFDIEEDLADYPNLPGIRNMPRKNNHLVAKKSGNNIFATAEQTIIEIANQQDGHEDFNFTYKAARHEGEWLTSSLVGFYRGNWIEDVLRSLKSGKEASVYLCAARQSHGLHCPFIAAKVYRPRQLRNLRKDHLYREGRTDLDIEGRTVKNEGMHHAMKKHTEYGQELLHTSWIGHEFKTMQILYEAGVDLPKPYTSGSNVILMNYIGARDFPAPTLNTVDLDPDEAQVLFKRILYNIDLMLTHHRVHGDLSAFNVLYWEGQISLIDFPQAIDPDENRNAYRIFERDVRRICEYFVNQGVSCDSGRLARELWTSHRYPLQPVVHPRLLDDQDERDRDYWQNLQNG